MRLKSVVHKYEAFDGGGIASKLFLRGSFALPHLLALVQVAGPADARRAAFADLETAWFAHKLCVPTW